MVNSILNIFEGKNMKNILIGCVLYVLSGLATATDLVLPIQHVIDGDTIGTLVKLPCPLCALSVRIRGIDTPESTYLAKCPAEQTKGLAAKAYLTAFVAGQTTMLARNVKWDKYGGRIDAIVEINGVNIGDEMIKQGFAKLYTGVGPKPDWCS